MNNDKLVTKGKLNNEISRLHKRLDSHSRRLSDATKLCRQVMSNRTHYDKFRLPAVLERQKAFTNYMQAYNRAKKLLESLDIQSLTIKKGKRIIGLFSETDMQRLRSLLKMDFRKKLLRPKSDDMHVVYLVKEDLINLKNLLKKHRRMECLHSEIKKPENS